MAHFDVTGTPPSAKAIAHGHIRECAMTTGFFVGLIAVVGSLVLVAAFKLPIFFCMTLAGFLLMLLRVSNRATDFTDLPENKCGELLDLCEKTVEGRQYRRAVLEQGRKFAREELDMMERWVDGIAHRASCKQLYGIAGDIDMDGRT